MQKEGETVHDVENTLTVDVFYRLFPLILRRGTRAFVQREGMNEETNQPKKNSDMKTRKMWLTIMAVSVMSFGTIRAQGIHAGYVKSTYRTSVGNGATSYGEAMNGFEVGFDRTFKVARGIIAVDYGLNYTYLRSKDDFYNVNMKYVNHYLDIPVHLQLGIPLMGVARIFAYGGPKFVLGLSSKMKTEMEVMGTTYDVTYNCYKGSFKTSGLDESDLTFSDNMPRYKRPDIMMGVGGGVELLNLLTIKAGYEWGLLNLSKTDALDIKRNQFVVSAGISF